MSFTDDALARDDREHPIPTVFRDMFGQVVEAFAAGDLTLQRHRIEGVEAIDARTAEFIRRAVADYGDVLVRLDDAVWTRSCYRWMDGYWSMLIDLSTTREAVSDLTLYADLADHPRVLRVRSVHVP